MRILQYKAVGAIEPLTAAFGHTVDDVHLPHDVPSLDMLGVRKFDALCPHTLCPHTLPDFVKVRIERLARVNQDGTAVFGGLRPVFDVFVAVDDEPGPGLADGDRLHVAPQ